MNMWVTLAAVFVSVFIVVLTVSNVLATRRQQRQNVMAARRVPSHRKALSEHDLDAVLSDEDAVMRYYFEVIRNDDPESLRSRMIRAGFFSRRGPFFFNLIRSIVAFGIFVLLWWGISNMFVGIRPAMVVILAMILSATSFILMNVFLDKLGKQKEIGYRKLFPDFLDLLIVCLDAGLSIEAALDRVTREYLVTNPDFGTHLGVILLELRAGRQLNDALLSFSEQTNLPEARSLAILFRQAVELGSSVGKTLRVFAKEMREMRIVRAEEKANALPIKMLFPLALFLFPVNLIIVLVPILLAILKMFMSLGAPP